MKTGLIALAVVALVVVGAVGWFVSVNNDLVAKDQAVRESWAQVQNVYQRRADLIPNLVETVKGFAAQERAVLEEVTRARASASSIQVTPELLNDPAALRRFQEAQSQLGSALSRLLVTVERYPDLKSNQNFLALQSQLEGTENRIAVERRRFNEAVRGTTPPSGGCPAASSRPCEASGSGPSSRRRRAARRPHRSSSSRGLGGEDRRLASASPRGAPGSSGCRGLTGVPPPLAFFSGHAPMKPRIRQQARFSALYVAVAVIVLVFLQSWLLAPQAEEIR